MALTALGFLSDAAVAESSFTSGGGGGGSGGGSSSSTLVVGGTRGGGVAAWDITTGACVLAAPGSHAGAVTQVRAAAMAGPAAGAVSGPALALTASSVGPTRFRPPRHRHAI
jgi:hypothetical protein